MQIKLRNDSELEKSILDLYSTSQILKYDPSPFKITLNFK